MTSKQPKEKGRVVRRIQALPVDVRAESTETDPYRKLAEKVLRVAVLDMKEFIRLGIIKDGEVVTDETDDGKILGGGLIKNARDTVLFFKNGDFAEYVNLLGYPIAVDDVMRELGLK